jgi:hypothetical protein
MITKVRPYLDENFMRSLILASPYPLNTHHLFVFLWNTAVCTVHLDSAHTFGSVPFTFLIYISSRSNKRIDTYLPIAL